MGEILKLKINIGNANVELEGEGSLVHTIFSELREFGLGKLSNCEPASHSLGQQNNTKDTTREDEQEEAVTQEAKEKTIEIPNIKDIVMKNLPKTEAEWVLVYALYASNMGSQHLQPTICARCIMKQIDIPKTEEKTLQPILRKRSQAIGLTV